ncbi:MAG TPA: nuclear transport factor 2 family protein [Baekduia sp.]|nr:nuclear transport factor 2 family protein [Baekduia sp.]
MDQADRDLLDRLAIRELSDDWMMYRDQLDWERVAATWHEGGVMATTWGGTATPEEFAAAAQAGFERGDRMLHSNGGVSVTLSGDRAIAQTKLRIMQRAEVDGVLCDVTCIGRDYDFCERRDSKWGFVMRQPIFERDMIVPVDPSETIKLPEAELAKLPEGYSRLGYLQAQLGYEIYPAMPVLEGPAVEALYAAGEAWLAGKPLAWGKS